MYQTHILARPVYIQYITQHRTHIYTHHRFDASTSRKHWSWLRAKVQMIITRSFMVIMVMMMTTMDDDKADVWHFQPRCSVMAGQSTATSTTFPTLPHAPLVTPLYLWASAGRYACRNMTKPFTIGRNRNRILLLCIIYVKWHVFVYTHKYMCVLLLQCCWRYDISRMICHVGLLECLHNVIPKIIWET